MNCPSCETANRPGAERCKRCLKQLPPNCPGCGAPLGETEPELCLSCRTERIPAALGDDDLLPGVGGPQAATVVSGVNFELRPRFVGREAILGRLRRAFDDVRGLREISFLTIIGPAGSGKTRLLSELERSIKDVAPHARFLTGSGQGSASVPYGAFVRIVSHRFGITTHDTPAEAQQKIIAGVGEVVPAPKVTEVAHLLAHLLRVEFTGSPIVEPLAEAPQQLETRTFIALKRFLAADAARQPLILALDDLDQAGPETTNLLQYLAAGLASTQVLLVAAGRPNLFEVHPGFGEGEISVGRLDLGPLEEAESESLLRELLRPVESIPDTLLEHARKLGGVPRALFRDGAAPPRG
jgi:predicted ATPase